MTISLLTGTTVPSAAMVSNYELILQEIYNNAFATYRNVGGIVECYVCAAGKKIFEFNRVNSTSFSQRVSLAWHLRTIYATACVSPPFIPMKLKLDAIHIRTVTFITLCRERHTCNLFHPNTNNDFSCSIRIRVGTYDLTTFVVVTNDDNYSSKEF